MHLDHITLKTRDLARAQAFFPTVFDDPKERTRPKAIRRIPGHRLYTGDRPIIHLIAARGHGIESSAEAFDQVGIHLDGYTTFRARLDDLAIPSPPVPSSTLTVAHSSTEFPLLQERNTPCY